MSSPGRSGVVGRAVSARISVQILAGVLFRAGEGRLTVAATDMEMSLRATLDADMREKEASSYRGVSLSTSFGFCLRVKLSSRTRLTRQHSS